jgi:hypothetical protein
MKHKWHKEIKAWADGAEIETCKAGVWIENDYPQWHSSDYQFRIKSHPKEPQYLYAYSTSQGIKFCGKGGTIEVTSSNEFIMRIGKIKLEVDDE